MPYDSMGFWYNDGKAGATPATAGSTPQNPFGGSGLAQGAPSMMGNASAGALGSMFGSTATPDRQQQAAQPGQQSTTPQNPWGSSATAWGAQPSQNQFGSAYGAFGGPTAQPGTQSTSASTPQGSSQSQPFTDYNSFRAWENTLGDTYSQDYQVPDYVRNMGLMGSGGDDSAAARYLYFQNNPGIAQDWARVRSGQTSQFATDGSTLSQQQRAPYDPATGEIVNFDGSRWNPITNQQVSGPTSGAPSQGGSTGGTTSGPQGGTWNQGVSGNVYNGTGSSYGGSTGGSSSSSSGSNPYLTDMGNAITSTVNQNMQRNQLPQIRSSAVASGNYGGSRQGVVEANAQSDANTSIANALANLYGTDWTNSQNRALQQYGIDLNYDLGLTNSNNSFYTAQRGQDLQSTALGAQLTNMGNQGYLSGGQGVYNIGNTEQQAPWTVVGNYGNSLTPYTGFGTTTAAGGSNPISNLFGGAMAGGQLFSLLGGGRATT